MKKALLLTLSVILSVPSFSQLSGWYQNLEKYWWYRYRLVNDFMKIGSNPGESIPAGHRIKTE
ncbi:MAG TPA: hypothetical protein PL009_09160 [Flavipsychrobacter sp.]|nr:hypothetical protein [Flavipsychrobacter sp.]